MTAPDQPLTTPFEVVGADAPVCIDGVCVLPTTDGAPPSDPAGTRGNTPEADAGGDSSGD